MHAFELSDYLEIKVDALRLLLKCFLHLPRNTVTRKLLDGLVKGLPGIVARTLQSDRKHPFKVLVFEDAQRSDPAEQPIGESQIQSVLANTTKTCAKGSCSDDWNLPVPKPKQSKQTLSDNLDWLSGIKVKSFRDDSNIHKPADTKTPKFARNMKQFGWSAQNVFYFMFDVCKNLMHLNIDDPFGEKTSISPETDPKEGASLRLRNSQLLDCLPYIYNSVDVHTQCRMLEYLRSLSEVEENIPHLLGNQLFLAFLMRELVKDCLSLPDLRAKMFARELPEFESSQLLKRSRVCTFCYPASQRIGFRHYPSRNRERRNPASAVCCGSQLEHSTQCC